METTSNDQVFSPATNGEHAMESTETNETTVTSQGYRVKNVTHDNRREAILNRIQEQLETNPDAIMVDLSAQFLEQVKTLQTQLQAAFAKDKAFKRKKLTKTDTLSQRYVDLERHLRDMWSLVKITFRDHAQVKDIYTLFALSREGFLPKNLSRMNLCKFGKTILEAEALATESGYTLPTSLNFEGLRQLLTEIKGDEQVVYSLHTQRAVLTTAFKEVRDDIRRFFQAVRARVRGTNPHLDGPTLRNIQRALGFVFVGPDGQETNVEDTPEQSSTGS